MRSGNYEVERLILTDLDGRSKGIVVAKATFVVGDDRIPVPAPEPEKILFAAVPANEEDPESSPVLFDSDAVPAKAGTDVMVHGTAFAPKNRKATAFEVEVTVGGQRRGLRVFGPRKASYRKPSKQTKKETVYRPPVFSDPEPVVRVPVDFTRAYGGVALFEPPGGGDVVEMPCPSNPLGMGYCVQNSAAGLDGIDLPQVEDPSRLLTPENMVRQPGSLDDLPLPAGFGSCRASWYPRVSFAGVMPNELEEAKERLREQVSSLDPEKDADTIAMLESYEPPVMDARFYQSAVPSMVFPHLTGDEPMAFRNMTPDGTLAFNLPGVRPLVRLESAGGTLSVPTTLDTVTFLVDDMKLVLVFRGAIPLDLLGGDESFSALPMGLEDVEARVYSKVVADEEGG